MPAFSFSVSGGGGGGGSSDANIIFVIDNAGSPIMPGESIDIEVPFNCTITRATVLANDVGDLEIDIWKTTYASFPPTVTDSIVGASPPEIVSDEKYLDTTLAGWTTAISAGDILRINVVSAAVISSATLILRVQK